MTIEQNANESKVRVEVTLPAAGGQPTATSSGGNDAPSAAGQQNESASANNGGGSADGRGKVLNPETDGRLKGNEEMRPNDKDRSAQAEGGRRGGQNSHNNDRSNSNDNE